MGNIFHLPWKLFTFQYQTKLTNLNDIITNKNDSSLHHGNSNGNNHAGYHYSITLRSCSIPSSSSAAASVGDATHHIDNTICNMKIKFESPSQYYIFHTELGSGAYSKVYLATPITTISRIRSLSRSDSNLVSPSQVDLSIANSSQTNLNTVGISEGTCRVAIKVMKLNEISTQEKDTLHNELNILSQLSHPNIVKLYDIYIDNDMIYMVTEYIQGKGLFDQCTLYHEATALHLFIQLINTLAYLHGKNVIHRDIKPSNILVISHGNQSSCNRNTNLSIKLIDFGFAILDNDTLRSKHTGRMIGTAGYIAPEGLEDGTYYLSSDIWSAGIILYEMLTGSNGGLYTNALDDDDMSQIDYLSKASRDVKDLLSKMLTRDPEHRITAKEILNHPWIKSYQNDFQCSSPSHSSNQSTGTTTSTTSASSSSTGNASSSLISHLPRILPKFSSVTICILCIIKLKHKHASEHHRIVPGGEPSGLRCISSQTSLETAAAVAVKHRFSRHRMDSIECDDNDDISVTVSTENYKKR